MELYVERGYENTTVADIADRAGLTARTFFRYFADKREVLFAGSLALQVAMAAALDGAPASAAPFDAVAGALDASAVWLDGDRAYAARRQSVIAANAELRERELIKMASLAGALTEGLRRRGVAEPDASLAAEAGIAVFRIAFHRWVRDSEERELALVMRECLQQMRALTAQRD
ncbi:MAG: regulatory protein TetR [Jatrophihabitantaceae bacterium]|nr:regulatory protein TetR [Jatrophihabitantaceae bacterium]